MTEQFVSQAIEPQPGTFDAAAMARGEAGLPGRFTWRGRLYTVSRLLKAWKSSSPGGCGEVYLRRHWFEIMTDSGERMTLYCERQARSRGGKARWWLYTIVSV